MATKKQLTIFEIMKQDLEFFRENKEQLTVNDQINRAFRSLRKLGFDARRNFACCPGCDTPKNEEKFALTITQHDKAKFKDDSGWFDPQPSSDWLTIFWSDTPKHTIQPENIDEKPIKVADPDDIIKVLEANGLIVAPISAILRTEIADTPIRIHTTSLL